MKLRRRVKCLSKMIYLNNNVYFRELEHVNILKLLGQCTETLPFLVIMEFPALVCEPSHEKNNNLCS